MRPLLAILMLCCVGCQDTGRTGAALIGITRIPAGTFRQGPAAGNFIEPSNGAVPPFRQGQPVGGISAIVRDGRDWLVMPDNGFGKKENSADFILCLYRLNPDFKTSGGGAGVATPELLFQLRDPDKLAGFPIVADARMYPSSEIPVDPRILDGRLLTGADFDIEAFRKAPDGTFWFGDEFGPFLLHTDDTGKLLEKPVPIPGTRSPQNPLLKPDLPATIGTSKGIEGLALSHDGHHLLVLLEGPLNSEPNNRRLRMREYSLLSRTWVGSYYYRMEADSKSGQAIGALAAVDDTRLLVVERDNRQSAEARFKKIFMVDLADRDSNGFLPKREVVDLLNVPDPRRLAGAEGTYRMPFTCIESLELADEGTIVVANDNNFPSSTGRRTGVPEDTEIVMIRVPLAARTGR